MKTQARLGFENFRLIPPLSLRQLLAVTGLALKAKRHPIKKKNWFVLSPRIENFQKSFEFWNMVEKKEMKPIRLKRLSDKSDE